MLKQRYDRTIEQKWQKTWEDEGTCRFDDKGTTRPLYTIDTPPPFTSGELHMGHVLSYSYIDFTARFMRMRGFNVYYPQGWDTQGFPTEVRVEKKYGRLPPAEFRQKCVEWTVEMIARMKAQMMEMGFSPDWRYEYRTMDAEYHRKVQLSLVRMYGDKLIYRDKYPVFWCPRCGSAVAKAELDDEEKSGTLNYINFTGPDGEKLPIATSRPELMTACVAVLFNPEDTRYAHLEDKTVTTALGKQVPAFADKDVEKEFGTGLLMVCTFGDKMDVVWMHRYKLPLVEAIDRHGRMQNSGELNGLKADEARKKVIEILGDKVFRKEPLAQTIKVHDRCKTPVELIPSLQWFADIRTTGKHIKAIAEKVKWVPEFGISYLIDWVEGAEWDWVISRQRVFGTPLPFYGCECGATAAAGEDELPFYPEKAKGKACGCGRKMAAETSTCDCWVDSSITPLVIAGWPDEEKMKGFYPSSLRPQGVEIVRTWAFYTIYRSGVALTGLPPWETILLNGNVLAPDGKKMSKSLGNIVAPAELLRDYPTDAIRQWAALSGAMAKDRPFSYEDMKHAKSFLAKVWNAARFVETVAGSETGGKRELATEPGLTTIDKWIIGRLNTTVMQCTGHMEKFEFHYAMSKIQAFFWGDFCDNYIEYVKHRVYSEDKAAAAYVLRKVLGDTLLLMAPFTPHVAEEVHRELFGRKQSVHHANWPEAGPEYPGEAAKVTVLNAIVSQLRQHKATNRLAQNAELGKVRLSLPEEMDAELLAELSKISKIKEIETVKGEFGVSVL
jgi:valyl-tRNA synthetase